MINISRLRSTGDLRCRVESSVCDTCTDLCWSVEVWGHDILATGEKACWAYRAHMPTMATAMAHLARVLSTSAATMRLHDQRIWELEHQLSLFPSEG